MFSFQSPNGMGLTVCWLMACMFTIVQSVNPTSSDWESLNRDAYGRADPNQLLNGFFPGWAIILLCMSGVFMVISLISFIGMKLGCINPYKKKFKKVPAST